MVQVFEVLTIRNKFCRIGEGNTSPFLMETSMEETNTGYESYVHISNSGIAFKVQVSDLDNYYGATQELSIQLSSFGIPLTTTLKLDENSLAALEYIVAKAREQRNAFPQIKQKYVFTKAPVPPNNPDEVYGGDTCSDTPQAEVVVPIAKDA